MQPPTLIPKPKEIFSLEQLTDLGFKKAQAFVLEGKDYAVVVLPYGRDFYIDGIYKRAEE